VADPEIVDPGAEKRSTAPPTDRPRHSRRSIPRPPEWEPLKHAPERVQRRFANQLARAHQQPRVAIKLNCIECMGYVESEPGRCEATGCLFYAYNLRLFKRRGGAGSSEGSR
jgi:hypothetical protein